MSALELEVRFLDDRYHGSGEWPPDPARLFQALVCGGRTGAAAGVWSRTHEEALDWLANLPAPAIDCSQAPKGRAYSIFVPNNSLDRQRRNTKTTKRVEPRLLPPRRTEAPDLVYRWSLHDLEQARRHLPALDELAARLLSLGWGVDVAAASAALREADSTPGYVHYRPVPRGSRSMRTLAPGLLQRLEESHRAAVGRITKQGVNPYTRLADFPRTDYARTSEEACPRRHRAFSLQCLDGEPFSHPWSQAVAVAAWMRHMAGEAIDEEFPDPVHRNWIESFVMGHTAEQELGQRISYLPLPSIGHRHSDGAIRRALLVAPPGVEGQQAEAFDLLERKAKLRPLTRAGDRRPQAILAPPPPKDFVFDRYLGRHRSWRTVTPVVLHGHNARGKGISIRKTEKLLLQALEAADYPVAAVERISFQTAPYWSGSEAAAAIRTPAHLNRWPRLHVAIDFKNPVAGPLAIGLGRHCGIGVFAGLRD